MPHSKEEIQAAIRIADRVATRELRKKRLSELQAPETILDGARELQGSGLEELLDNPLAEKFLPQARIIVAERHARKSALEDTVLGRMESALGYITACFGAKFEDPLSDTSKPFDDDEVNAEWQKLLEAIKTGNGESICDALLDIVQSARVNIFFADLPSVKSDYEEISE